MAIDAAKTSKHIEVQAMKAFKRQDINDLLKHLQAVMIASDTAYDAKTETDIEGDLIIGYTNIINDLIKDDDDFPKRKEIENLIMLGLQESVCHQEQATRAARDVASVAVRLSKLVPLLVKNRVL